MDRELRALERATENRPHDSEVHAALARALVRSGERRRALNEFLEQAHRGDADARERVARWNELPPLRGRPIASESELMPGPLDLCGASPVAVFVRAGSEVVGLEAGSLDPIWSAKTGPGPTGPARETSALCGEDLVVSELRSEYFQGLRVHEYSTLSFLDGGTGDQVGRIEFPGRLVRLVGVGDIAIAVLSPFRVGEHERHAGLVAVARDSSQRWSNTSVRPELTLAGSWWVATSLGGGTSVIAAESGEVVATHPLTSPIEGDRNGAVLIHELGRRRVLEVSGSEVRWSREEEDRVRRVHLTREVAVLELLRRDSFAFRHHLVAIERSSGAVSWEADLGPERLDAPALMAASDHLLLAGREPESPSIELIDAVTGARLTAGRVQCGGPTYFGDSIPIAGGVLARYERPGRPPILVRIEGQA